MLPTHHLAPLIVATRNDQLENLHLGAIAHVDAHGRVLSHVGNPQWLSFTRSTLKALQALPFVEGGGVQAFGFNTQQTALLCASHNGEDAHVAQVSGMLDAIRLPYKALGCGCHLPALYTTGGQTPPAEPVFDERHNNCSGKHSGMLAHCVQHGLATDTYLDFDHPLGDAAMPWGTDGCSAPNYAMPLAALATGYARMAAACAGRSAGVSDTTAQAMATLGGAMAAEPYMVAGQGRNDLAFMQAGRGDWITKVGADAVQVVASISRGEAFALKIADASLVALHATTVAVLDQLGWLDDAQRDALQVWRSAEIRNVRGLLVGERRSVFHVSPKS
jgi:L-asparaginase II